MWSKKGAMTRLVVYYQLYDTWGSTAFLIKWTHMDTFYLWKIECHELTKDSESVLGVAKLATHGFFQLKSGVPKLTPPPPASYHLRVSNQLTLAISAFSEKRSHWKSWDFSKLTVEIYSNWWFEKPSHLKKMLVKIGSFHQVWVKIKHIWVAT